ncbi:MAG: class I SAM-dependent methyltransferase [Planctomycetota bacterium]
MKQVVSWISEITGESQDKVAVRLREEYDSPGLNVSRGLNEAGVAPFIWCDGMAQFYEKTDGFLYELVIWNLNGLKASMRNAVMRHVNAATPGPAKVLNIGDGLGIDTVEMAEQGHHPTYFELPGFTQSFARKVFAQSGHDITMLSDDGDIPKEGFDAVVCLDVLEHVPDPPSFVEMLTGYLRPGGRLIIHETFLWIHPSNPTHLAASRKYSGDLSLYRRCGLCLVDGQLAWDPIVFVKPADGFKPPSALSPRLVKVRLAGLIMALGRFSVLPFVWVNALRRIKGRWFDGGDELPAAVDRMSLANEK